VTYLIPIVAAVAISQSWFRSGTFIAGGDLTPFISDGLESEYGSHWNHLASGAGSPNYQISLATQVLIVKFVRSLGGSEYTAQRLFYALLLASVALGTAYFVRAFTAKPMPVAAAGLVGVVNPFVMTQAMNPLALLALAIMGLLGGMVLRVGHGERVSALGFAFVTLGCSYLALNPPLLLVAAAWVAAVAVAASRSRPGASKRMVAFLVRALPWSLLLNLWWLVPMLLMLLGSRAGPGFTAQTDVQAWSWTHVRNSIPNVLGLNTSWAWEHAAYFPYAEDLDRPAWEWMRFVLPATALAAPLVTLGKERRVAAWLVGFVLALVFLGKGLHPPLSGVNAWLYDHVPGSWLLREPMSKIGPAIVLCLAVLFALTMGALMDRSQELTKYPQRLVLLAVAAGTAAVLVYPYPIWNGSAIPGDRPSLPPAHVSVPDGWLAAARFVNDSSVRGKVLMLPVDDYYQMPTTWGYYGTDFVAQLLVRRPVIQLLPDAYYSEEGTFADLVRGVEDSLARGDTDDIPRLLQALGVSHVLLRRDLDLEFPGRSFQDPARLEVALATVRGLHWERSFDVVDIYEVTRPTAGPVSSISGSRGVDGGADLAAPATSWEMIDPSRYRVEIDGAPGPFVLRLAETYSDGWRIRASPDVDIEHIRLDGYANGWAIGAGGDLSLELEYVPAAWARKALVISQIGIVLGAFLGVLALRRNLQGTDSGARDRADGGSTIDGERAP
jgi:arabinofuranan 3-O-arabinosyltransferase